MKGPDQFFTFHLGGSEPLRVQANAARGLIINIESDEEDIFVRLHSGKIVGDGGNVLGLGWGLGSHAQHPRPTSAASPAFSR